MDDKVKAGLETTLNVLEVLVPIALQVTAMVAGVPIPVTQGLKVATALLPIADEFLVKIGDKTISLDTKGITDAQAIAALRKDREEGWPVLTFA